MAKDKISSTVKKLGRYAKKIGRYEDRATDILSQLSQSADRIKFPQYPDGRTLPRDIPSEELFRVYKELKKRSKKLKLLVKKIGAYLSLISESLPVLLQKRQESEAFKAEPLKLAEELDIVVRSIITSIETLKSDGVTLTEVKWYTELNKRLTPLEKLKIDGGKYEEMGSYLREINSIITDINKAKKLLKQTNEWCWGAVERERKG